jgi:hypothetical protein
LREQPGVERELRYLTPSRLAGMKLAALNTDGGAWISLTAED